MYDVDFDHQFIETEKYDAKPTYNKFLGYRPGVAVIDDLIVGIENSDGNKMCIRDSEFLRLHLRLVLCLSLNIQSKELRSIGG